MVAEDAASVEVERSPLMWLFGGRRVRVNTAGLRRRADATLYLPARTARGLLGADGRRKEKKAVYASRILPVTVLAASGSNAAVGLLTLAPAVKQISNLLGQQVPDQVYGLLDGGIDGFCGRHDAEQQNKRRPFAPCERKIRRKAQHIGRSCQMYPEMPFMPHAEPKPACGTGETAQESLHMTFLRPGLPGKQKEAAARSRHREGRRPSALLLIAEHIARAAGQTD